MSEPRLVHVKGEFTACSACLDGEGGECHTPGCVFWLMRAPDLSLRDNLLMHECVLTDIADQEVIGGQ